MPRTSPPERPELTAETSAEWLSIDTGCPGFRTAVARGQHGARSVPGPPGDPLDGVDSEIERLNGLIDRIFALSHLQTADHPHDSRRLRGTDRRSGQRCAQGAEKDIFEPFVRLQGELTPGYGLALTIAKRSIEASNQTPAGLAVTITLPVRPPAARPNDSR